MSDSVAGRTILTIVKISFLIISTILFAIAYFFNKENIELGKWHKAEAKIFYSKIVKKQTTVFNRPLEYNDLILRYSYIVENTRYNSTNFFANDDIAKNHTKEFLLEESKNYKKGSVVEVFYNPKNPNESYLKADEMSGDASFYEAIKKLLIFSVLLLFLQPILSFFEAKRNKKEQDHFEQQNFEIPDDVIRVQPIRKHR